MCERNGSVVCVWRVSGTTNGPPCVVGRQVKVVVVVCVGKVGSRKQSGERKCRRAW